MNFSLYIAKRYLRSKSSNNAINFITYIAILGIVLGSASLFIVLSGFSGLKDFTLQFSSLIDPDLKAFPTEGKTFTLSEEQISQLKNTEEIAHFSKILQEQVIVTFDGKNYPATLKAVDENYESVTSIDNAVSPGNWFEQSTNEMVAGWGVSVNLSFGVLDYGKRVSLSVPKPGKGQVSSLKDAFNTVDVINVGIFDINETLNDTYIYTPLSVGQQLLGVELNAFSSLEFKLKPNADEATAREKIKQILGNPVALKNKIQLNDAIYKMLNTENLAVYLIFTLVLIVALFNIVGSLIMMILDKKKTLNTLFNLGATVKSIQKIFFLQGTLMSIIGGLIGLLIGLVLVLLQKEFGMVPITPSLPYPVSVNLWNLVVVFLTISAFGILASKIASMRISKNLLESAL